MMNEHRWVTAIQIGTKECTIAHQSLRDFNTNPTQVLAHTYHGNDTLHTSFPPSLMISIKGSLASFGFSAVDKYNDTKDGIFFENIIESLYYSEEFNEETLIKDSTGITYNALGVFSKFLKAVFEYIEYELKRVPDFDLKHDTAWVLALPSVRAGRAVPFFIKGWEKTGLPKDIVTTVTYPNAVLNYCVYLPSEQCNGTSFEKFRTGDRVMVISFEDELDSFNVFEKLENQSFKQIVNHLSGTGSKDAIMIAFDMFFSDLYGSWIWKVVKKKYKSTWSSVVSYIDIWLTMEKEYKQVTMALEVNLTDKYDEHINMTLRQNIEQSEYASQVKVISDKLRIDPNLIKSLFGKIFKKVIHSIAYAFTRVEGKEVSTMILAGNIANSSMLKCAIEEEFPNKHIFAIKQAELAALKGACLFGHKPIVVSSIFCGAQVMVSR